jgi:hypothetical protein
LPHFSQDFKAHTLPDSFRFDNKSHHYAHTYELASKVAGEVRAGFCSGNLKGPYGIYRHRWADNIKMYVQEIGPDTWSGLIWLLIETSDELM